MSDPTKTGDGNGISLLSPSVRLESSPTAGALGGGMPDGADPAGGGGGVAAGQAATGTEAFAFLPEGLKGLAEGFDKPETFWAQAGDLFRLAKERELVTGKRVPDSMASQEEWEAFHKALGRPDKPEGYTLPERFEAEGVPPELASAVSELLARDKGEFSTLMHKHGLSQRQAEGMFRDIGSILAKSLGETQASAPDPQKVVTELWPQDTEKNLDLARRGARALGVGDALDEAGLSAHPLVLKLAHALGEMTAEDRLRDGGGPTAPMPVGQEAYQEMLRLVGSDAYQKNDPATVRRVEQLAGRVNMK